MSAEMLARDQLKSIVQRVERLESEIADLNADKSDIYKEARANGFDVKAIKKVVQKRKLDDHERQEQDLVFDTYWDAVHGIGLVHAHARENIEEFDPITGEFVDDNTQASNGSNVDRPSLAARDDEESAATIKPETANEVPAQDGGGTALGDKSNAARPASVDAYVNDGRLAGEVGAEVVTVVGTESGTVSSPTTDQPLAGGSHVDQGDIAPTHQAGAVRIAPAAFTLRPNCRNPGSTCAGHGSTHCHRCTVAMREGVAA